MSPLPAALLARDVPGQVVDVVPAVEQPAVPSVDVADRGGRCDDVSKTARGLVSHAMSFRGTRSLDEKPGDGTDGATGRVYHVLAYPRQGPAQRRRPPRGCPTRLPPAVSSHYGGVTGAVGVAGRQASDPHR